MYNNHPAMYIKVIEFFKISINMLLYLIYQLYKIMPINLTILKLIIMVTM